MRFGRRVGARTPDLAGRTWNDVREELHDWVRESQDSQDNGLPPGFSETTPTTVEIGAVGSAGDEGTGWAAADHEHPVGDPGPPANVEAVAAEGISTTPSRADHVHKLGIITTEGDIIVHGPTVPQALPIGGAGSVLVSDGTTAAWRLLSVLSLPFYDEHDWRDQFTTRTVDAAVAGSLVGTQVGTLGWRGPLSAQVADTTAEASHPGIVTVTSGTATGSSTPLSLATVVIADIYQATAILRLPNVTNAACRFGLLRTLAGAGNASRGNYFSLLPSVSPNWFAVTRNGSGITATDTGVVAVAGDWYLLEMYEDTPGQIDFYVNGAGPTSNTTNVEVLDAFPAYEIETESGGNAKAVDVDFFWMQTILLTGQFP